MTDWRTLTDQQLRAALIAAGEHAHGAAILTRSRHIDVGQQLITRILQHPEETE